MEFTTNEETGIGGGDPITVSSLDTEPRTTEATRERRIVAVVESLA
ncbi:hypothetical protein [Pseudoclavibacter sp. AY1F1]|nr:hypothetical protein [Pseudoclavibacter sp. AY1F1]